MFSLGFKYNFYLSNTSSVTSLPDLWATNSSVWWIYYSLDKPSPANRTQAGAWWNCPDVNLQKGGLIGVTDFWKLFPVGDGWIGCVAYSPKCIYSILPVQGDRAHFYWGKASMGHLGRQGVWIISIIWAPDRQLGFRFRPRKDDGERCMVFTLSWILLKDPSRMLQGWGVYAVCFRALQGHSCNSSLYWPVSFLGALGKDFVWREYTTIEKKIMEMILEWSWDLSQIV